MHLPHHFDDCCTATLPLAGTQPELAHLLAKSAGRPTLPGRVIRFARWLTAKRDYHRTEMGIFEYGDHPDADQCRLRLRTVETIMAELVRQEILPHTYLLEHPPTERPCSITTQAPDICHGQEVPPPVRRCTATR
jgi:hypothetical protein